KAAGPAGSRPLLAKFTSDPLIRGDQERKRLALLFVSGDLLFVVLERDADVVEAVEQAVATVLVDGERDPKAEVVADLALLQVDGELVALVRLGELEELLDGSGLENDRQDTVLEAVVVEDVGEGRSDD